MSVGTLFSYTTVNVCLLLMRYQSAKETPFELEGEYNKFRMNAIFQVEGAQSQGITRVNSKIGHQMWRMETIR